MPRSVMSRTLCAFVLTLAFVGSPSAQASPPKGNLYVLAVGVSQFVLPGNDLVWADQDAIDHAKLWRAQEGRLYNRVIVKVLLNREATRANILQAMEEIAQQVQPGDTVIAPWSSHGTDPQKYGGVWYFCAADCRSGGLIPASVLRDWVVKLTQKGAHVVYIIDACFAGAVDIQVDGALVITAAQADEPSLDGSALALHGNGLFTEVLLEGLSGKADFNGDGYITEAEIVEYVNQHVPERYLKLMKDGTTQRPKVFQTSNASANQPLAQLNGPAPTNHPTPGPTIGPGIVVPVHPAAPTTGPLSGR